MSAGQSILGHIPSRIKVGSWNVAACKDVERDIGAWFVEGKGIDQKLAGLDVSDGIEEDHSQDGIESVSAQEERRRKKHSTLPLNDTGTIAGGGDIDLYVLGLQEVVELSSAKEYLTRVYADPSTALKWKAAMIAALPAGYQLVSEQQLSGLLMLIYASPDLAPTISSVSSVAVGTGFFGIFGKQRRRNYQDSTWRNNTPCFCQLPSGLWNRFCTSGTKMLGRHADTKQDPF